MICPILSIGSLVKGQPHTDCAKERCEWWNPLVKGCDPTARFVKKIDDNEYLANRARTRMSMTHDGPIYRDNT